MLKVCHFSKLLQRSASIVFNFRSRCFAFISLSEVDQAEVLRMKRLVEIYKGPFSNLGKEERLSLAKSGQVWWNFANFEGRSLNQIPDLLLAKLHELDCKVKEIDNRDLLVDDKSPVWTAFRLALTHNSTAIEGNKLNVSETKTVIDEFAVGISKGLGMSEFDDISSFSTEVQQLPKNDVSEVVNHAAAMEYARQHLIGKPLSVDSIVKLHKILMPDVDSTFYMIPYGLEDTKFRMLPIRVRGSPVVRPYGHEVPAIMDKLLSLHEEQSKIYHPLVYCTSFYMNFLMVHPFHDGNGRLARLLLWILLHNAGYFGLNFHV